MRVPDRTDEREPETLHVRPLPVRQPVPGLVVARPGRPPVAKRQRGGDRLLLHPVEHLSGVGRHVAHQGVVAGELVGLEHVPAANRDRWNREVTAKLPDRAGHVRLGAEHTHVQRQVGRITQV